MKQLEIKELQPLIIEWANKRNLNDSDKQYLKILEEVGETAKAILQNDIDEIKDGIGDIAVTIIIYYKQINAPLYLDYNIGEDYYAKSSGYLNETLKDVSNKHSIVLWCLDKLSRINNTTLKECLNLAWNEIKHREGQTINGTFIKN